jgi:hypothetical protein
VSLGAASISKAGGSSASADNRAAPPKYTPTTAAQPATFHAATARSNKPYGTGRRTKHEKQTIVWIAGGGIALMAVVGACLLLIRPTWEEKNRAQIIAMKTDADGLLQRGQAEAAYARYKELFGFVGDHEIHGDFIRTELTIAKSGMERAYADAAPLIEKRRGRSARGSG